jgi:hypothetical protein
MNGSANAASTMHDPLMPPISRTPALPEVDRIHEAERALRQILLGGPANSQAVVLEMVARGYSAKQTRRAREAQGLVVMLQ